MSYPLQNGNTPLHIAAAGGHTTFNGCLLSSPGTDVNITNKVSSCLLNNGLMVHVVYMYMYLPIHVCI